ncbi:LysR family transcriptional regulator [Kineococcus gynurae]|uniref:LysR family transcriptional regulator n=1 Tax=Kineococcus gynurae TaxID=452979 RepID=A0ABV5LMR4_9ACTN
MALDVRRMLMLADVAEAGSLSAAAERLSYTVSAVSQQIRRLEDEAGQPLLERLPRGVRLTDAGEALAARARRIELELRAARAELDQLSGLERGSLRLGSFPTVSSSLLPLVLSRFLIAHPGIDLRVRSALQDDLVEALRTREVELALLWDYPWNRFADPEIATTVLLTDPSVLVVPRDGPLADRIDPSLRSLREQAWIVRSHRHPVGEVLLRSCLTQGFEPTIAYEAQDYQETQAMVAAGLGIALAPRLGLTNLRDDVRLLRPAPSDRVAARRVLLAHVADRRLSPAARAIAQDFRDATATLTLDSLAAGQLGSVGRSTPD